MPDNDHNSDSENFNFINTITPRIFTELEDNLVELMGGPINNSKYSPSDEYLDSNDNACDNKYELKNVTLHDSLKEYDFKKNGNEMIFSFNNFLTKEKRYRNSKRKGIKTAKQVANYEKLDKYMYEMRNTKIDYDYNVSMVSDVIAKREKRVCGNWEGENKLCAGKNRPKIIKKVKKNKSVSF